MHVSASMLSEIPAHLFILDFITPHNIGMTHITKILITYLSPSPCHFASLFFSAPCFQTFLVTFLPVMCEVSFIQQNVTQSYNFHIYVCIFLGYYSTALQMCFFVASYFCHHLLGRHT